YHGAAEVAHVVLGETRVEGGPQVGARLDGKVRPARDGRDERRVEGRAAHAVELFAVQLRATPHADVRIVRGGEQKRGGDVQGEGERIDIRAEEVGGRIGDAGSWSGTWVRPPIQESVERHGIEVERIVLLGRPEHAAAEDGDVAAGFAPRQDAAVLRKL